MNQGDKNALLTLGGIALGWFLIEKLFGNNEYFKCPRCNYPLKEKVDKCPNCGQPLRWKK